MIAAHSHVDDVVASAAKQCGVDSSQVQDIYPCTPLQKEMFLHSLSGRKSQLAREVVELAEDVDVPRLQQAWKHVYQGLPILRTRFVRTESGELVQVVVREDLVWQSQTDHSTADAQHLPALGKRLAHWALIPEGKSSPNGHLIVTIHHALFDTITLGHIFGAVFTVYQGIQLPVQPVSFASFLARVAENQTQRQDSHEFWRSYLSNCTASAFPALPSPDYHPSANNGCQRHIPLLTSTEPALQRHGLTLSTLVRGAWAIMLSKHTNSAEDVLFASLVSGRNVTLPGIDHLAAPTQAYVPIRISIPPNEPASSFLSRMQTQATAMTSFEHDGIDYIRSIDEHVRDTCSKIGHLLVVQPLPAEASPAEFPGRIVSGPRVNVAAMGEFTWHGLMVQCIILPGGVLVRACFDDGVLSPGGMEGVIDEFGRALGELVEGLDV